MSRIFFVLSLLFLPLSAEAFSGSSSKQTWTGERFIADCVEADKGYCQDVFTAVVETVNTLDQNMGWYLVFQHQKLKNVMRKSKSPDEVAKKIAKFSDPKLRQTLAQCFPKDKDLYEVVKAFVVKREDVKKRHLSDIINMAAFEHWTCKRPGK